LSNELEVKLLGRFEVSCDGKPIAITSRPAQSLFAYLILNAGTLHRREKLAGILWPDSLAETARGNLRHALWRIRKALGSSSSNRFLHADDLGISFKAIADYWLDTAALKKLGEDAPTDELITVLSNYQGELLPGFYDEWVVLEREHLYSIFEHHMARLMSSLRDEMRWLEILDWAEWWIKLGQKPEPAYRDLMSAHAEKGDMSKVAATYHRCVKSLKELGFEPSEQTRALYARLKAGKETFEAGPTISVKEERETRPKTNLPIPVTSFIGREREIEEVKHLLSVTRLLTLTGSGGIGKTRLAIQAANELVKAYKGGVWWVELAPVIDSKLVPQAVAQALGVRESLGQPLTESVKNYLREKQLLLILDNCEHLITACAHVADDLLTQCADLRILTTSRETLGITGETTMRVPTLSFPVLTHLSQLQNFGEFESVQLFAERAMAVHPELALTQANTFMITQICRRLDGIPLALELAAARVKVLSLEEIATRLDDRFTLLTQGSRTALPRHQTLRAAIDWSYELLSGLEQNFFSRLSVFAGGFTLAMANEVATGGDVAKSQIIDLLGQLIDKSLVIIQARSKDSESETRYGMLESIHEYAREKLLSSGEEEHTRTKHLNYFLQFSEQADLALRGPKQMEWLERLKNDERDNLRAALGWAMKTKDIKTGLYIAGRLRLFWGRWDFHEGERWLAEFIHRPESYDYPIARAKALCAYGHVLWIIQKFSEAQNAAEECLALFRAYGDPQGEIDALLLMGNVLQYVGTMKSSIERRVDFRLKALALSKSLGDRWRQARALADLGWDHGDYLRARAYWEEAVALFREVGDALLLLDFLSSLGTLELLNGDFESAQVRLDESIQINRKMNNQVVTAHFYEAQARMAILNGDFEKGRSFLAEEMVMTQESGDRIMYLWARSHLGHLALRQGNLSEAKDIFIETTGGFFQGNNDIGIIYNLEGIAGLYVASEKPDQAAILIGWSDAAREKIGDRRPPIEQVDVDRDIAACLAKMGKVAFAQAYKEGQPMSFELAVEFALKET
jgi:predicted ATPase/DNA-binding SARP family transcriptional activator